eukprot:gene19463-29994_t
MPVRMELTGGSPRASDTPVGLRAYKAKPCLSSLFFSAKKPRKKDDDVHRRETGWCHRLGLGLDLGLADERGGEEAVYKHPPHEGQRKPLEPLPPPAAKGAAKNWADSVGSADPKEPFTSCILPEPIFESKQ